MKIDRPTTPPNSAPKTTDEVIWELTLKSAEKLEKSAADRLRANTGNVDSATFSNNITEASRAMNSRGLLLKVAEAYHNAIKKTTDEIKISD